jgi:hypothetical protein
LANRKPSDINRRGEVAGLYGQSEEKSRDYGRSCAKEGGLGAAATYDDPEEKQNERAEWCHVRSKFAKQSI